MALNSEMTFKDIEIVIEITVRKKKIKAFILIKTILTHYTFELHVFRLHLTLPEVS